jgi:Flp pilus assembly protein TadD
MKSEPVKSETRDLYAAPSSRDASPPARPSSLTRIRRRRSRFPWLPFVVAILAAVATMTVALAVLKARGRHGSGAAPARAAKPAPVADATPAAGGATLSDINRLLLETTHIRDLKTQVDQMQERGLHAEAAERVRRQMAVTPDSSELKALLGQLYLQSGRLEEARRMLIKALEADPGNMSARLDLARTLLELNENAGSLQVSRWILETSPNIAEVQKLAARACLKAGWNDASVQHLRATIAGHAFDLEARNMLGLAYLRQGGYARAIAHLQQIVKDGSADDVTYFNLAACFAQQRQPEDTVRVLVEAANAFGAEKVVGWMEADDFMPVRTSPVFYAARQQMTASLARDVMLSMKSPKRETGLGLMPVTNIRLRPMEFRK